MLVIVGKFVGRRGGAGGITGQLAADGRNVGEPAFASTSIESELDRQFGVCQQPELLGSGVLRLTLRHSCIIANGCDTVSG